MKKIRLLLPLLAFSCAAAMAQVTTTTTTTRHSTTVEPAISVPTVVTVHTHPARRHVVRHVRKARPVRHVVVRKTTRRTVAVVNTAPAAPGTTTTTTVVRHSSHLD